MPKDQDYFKEIANTYCKKRFLDGYSLGVDSLSEINNTYAVTLPDNSEYILKLITNKNDISIIEHDRTHIDAIIKLSRTINKFSNLIKTIDVTDVGWSNGVAVMLIKRVALIPLSANEFSFHYIGRCINEFHCAGVKARPQLIQLPWNNFPRTFIENLEKNHRWQEFKTILKQSQDLKTCIIFYIIY